MEFFKTIFAEAAVIKGAPFSFALCVIAASLLIFGVMAWGYGRENSYLRTQVDDYREKLRGATPVEARNKMDYLEKTIQENIGERWEPLTLTEIDALAKALAPLPKDYRVNVRYENAFGKDLARTISEAFEKAGFESVFLTPGAGLGTGLSVGEGQKKPRALKDAIESTTKLKAALLRPDYPEPADYVLVDVGIKSK